MIFGTNFRIINIFWLGLLLGMSTNTFAVFIDLASPNTALNGHSIANMQIGGQSVVTESGPMELDFNAALRNENPLILDVVIDGNDSRPYLGFSANLINLTNAPSDILILELSGAVTFDNVVNLSVSGLIDEDPSDQVVRLAFDSPITSGASLGIGQPDGVPDFNDWIINLNNLMVGDRFTLTIWTTDNLGAAAIPEPASIVLLILALGTFMAGPRLRPAKIIRS